jgi:pimeloyl-ACP methyl ester carboxylesterase
MNAQMTASGKKKPSSAPALIPSPSSGSSPRVGQAVLLLAGECDVGLPPRNAEYAGLFEHAELAVQPGAGRFPWLDDPASGEQVVAFAVEQQPHRQVSTSTAGLVTVVQGGCPVRT